jgi:hypothetical protein
MVLAPLIVLCSDGAYRLHLDGPENPRQPELLCDNKSRTRYVVSASDGPWCDFLQAALYNRGLDGSPADRIRREKARKAERNPDT